MSKSYFLSVIIIMWRHLKVVLIYPILLLFWVTRWKLNKSLISVILLFARHKEYRRQRSQNTRTITRMTTEANDAIKSMKRPWPLSLFSYQVSFLLHLINAYLIHVLILLIRERNGRTVNSKWKSSNNRNSLSSCFKISFRWPLNFLWKVFGCSVACDEVTKTEWLIVIVIDVESMVKILEFTTILAGELVFLIIGVEYVSLSLLRVAVLLLPNNAVISSFFNLIHLCLDTN